MPPISGARASARVSLSERGPFFRADPRALNLYGRFYLLYYQGSEVGHIPDVVYRLRDHFGLFVQVTS